MASFLPNLDTLTLPQQVAQMVVVRASGFLFDHQIQYPIWEPPAATLEHWVKDLGVGGVILLGASAGEIALRTQQLQNWASTPLLICADVEEGVGQRFSGATWFPPPMSIAEIAKRDLPLACHYAEQMGSITAEESLAIGLNWLLSPTVDVNNNPNNPVINVRAFGETPEIVSELAKAFIRGAHQHPILTTAKHFPGHGDTAVDSHLELPLIPHDRARLEAIEFPPFRNAVSAGVDVVMSAHLQVPALDPNYPATLSPKVLTDELRQNLGFEGVIVTDALVMGAIANRYGTAEACVLAVEAGADIMLMPLEPEKAIDAVCEAVEAGRIDRDRIRASVERIWRAKQKACIPEIPSEEGHAWENLASLPLETNDLTQKIAQPEMLATNAQLLRDSMRVYQPNPSRLVTLSGVGQNIVVVDSILDCEFLGRTAPAIAVPSQFGFTQTQIIDRHTPYIDLSTRDASPSVLQLFIRGNPFRGIAGLTQAAQDWFTYLLNTDQLYAIVVYGSPYVLDRFIPQLPSDVPYVFSYGQMQSAQAISLEALFGSPSKVAIGQFI
ncbi:glycosyl hydrolase family 3 N terminal domain protein [Leptolyngbya boryana NIES-2135]|jgi:beta-glucosidase|uniref:beta-N-acetylhexosaminidase n=1 Tax=Leptolyngbya boryana NIES-2135 TaxID=1973484 RepID=A0A1Z4JAN7_LEPBY|nr:MULTISPECIES: glycoside hydrolase family 3 N-terminal domain-containing protein [Leptolyngbya]BAY53844.1 glycosyl hydrolase family 3 N terminal domain protein [Leptolyngbya boryana NIES-2135]MBD2367717.1 beta-glucosidase [Leptolyngbya sp. FACHB-161]MBD2374435.1 beta-glucosidase [Leptolyngbya sp. FACHB-238]MBD2398657.1 beta-glucosidase [Leptolyngbya sp. FACHB-239]MBD2406359.1 beta-glucosidase [Leptolyngbya sp. FACHB-402]